MKERLFNRNPTPLLKERGIALASLLGRISENANILYASCFPTTSRRLDGIFAFKRGMSPIIATMLLIALAVSIGVTIMNIGGLYYEQLRLENATCLKILINAFELENKKQCQNYEFKSIVNFYRVDETVTAPQCYSGIATGKGDICTKSKALLNSTLAPIKNIIK